VSPVRLAKSLQSPPKLSEDGNGLPAILKFLKFFFPILKRPQIPSHPTSAGRNVIARGTIRKFFPWNIHHPPSNGIAFLTLQMAKAMEAPHRSNIVNEPAGHPLMTVFENQRKRADPPSAPDDVIPKTRLRKETLSAALGKP